MAKIGEKINRVSVKNIAIYLGPIIVPLILRLFFEYYEQRDIWEMKKLIEISLIFLLVMAGTWLVYSTIEYFVILFVQYGNTMKRAVITSLFAWIPIMIGGLYMKAYPGGRLQSDIPLTIGIIVFPFAALFIVDAIKKSTSKYSAWIGMGLAVAISVMESIYFRGSRNAVLGMLIIVNTVIIYASCKIIFKEKTKANMIAIASSGLFFIVNSVVTGLIKGIFASGKVMESSYYPYYKKWIKDLLLNTRLIGKINDTQFYNNDAVYNYKNLIHAMCYENGYLMLGLYLFLLIIFIVLLFKMLSPKYKPEIRASYLSGVSSVTYFVVKSLVAVLFSVSVSPIPVNLPFAKNCLTDLIALTIIIYCFYKMGKTRNDEIEMGKEILIEAQKYFGDDPKLKVTSKENMQDIISMIILLNEKNMQEYHFMVIHDGMEYKNSYYAILSPSEDLYSIVVLKNSKKNDEYSYEITDVETQKGVFEKYKEVFGGMYI